MELSMGKKYHLFREEVRDFLEDSLTDDLRSDALLATSIFPDVERSLSWQRILNEKGWAAPNWPVEYGGTGWDPMQCLVYSEEAARAKAPRIIPMGIAMCGPCIIGCGTEEQKAHYLPKILNTEHVWCQGYSEPNSGSDLASLTCSAESDGEDYIVNGSKIWTSLAHQSNHIFCLVRTSNEGRPQQGITFLLIDMNTPGVTVDPILNLNRFHEQNSVFFDNVHVPKSNCIGQENGGWAVAKYLLKFERGEVLGPHTLVAQIEIIREAAKMQPTQDGSPLSKDQTFKRKLAKVEIDLQALVFSDHRMRSAKSPNDEPLGGASFIKILYSDLAQRMSTLHVEASGVNSMIFQPEALVPGNTVKALATETTKTAMARHLDNRATSIFAGSNEILRNIITKSVLGL
ncbi:MAG: acyl-CoA dehydrogenase family protein [Paracoccaceae bacterium]